MVVNADSLTWNSVFGIILEVLEPYQVKGEDTLTFGDQTKWIEHKQVARSLRSEEVGTSGAPRIYFRNSKAVRDYLECSPEVEDFLETTWPAITSYFGETVDIVLEVMSYPEEGASELVGWIQFAGDIQEGLEKLERFEDEWLEQQLMTVDNKFNYNIEFVG